MLRPVIGCGAAALLTALAAAAAQPPIAYPAKGQSVDQQTSDDRECRASAQGSAAPLASADDTAARVLGAAGDRAGVGLTGDIDHTQAGRAADIGAAAAAEKRQARGEHPASRDYYRAYSECMERRGYTMK